MWIKMELMTKEVIEPSCQLILSIGSKLWPLKASTAGLALSNFPIVSFTCDIIDEVCLIRRDKSIYK